MGRPSGSKTQKRRFAGTLRVELERHIMRGQCAYCRTPARPNRPLTREHVIPRARGGRRKDVTIIVPACARCNHHRGCRELIPFLLARPRRISSFLDYLTTLSPDSIRQVDPRIFAELYTAVAILSECITHGVNWRFEMERLCSGRSLHRRRYAARRAMGVISERVGRLQTADPASGAPSCPIPAPRSDVLPLHIDEPLDRMAARLLGVFALLWEISAELAERELARELNGVSNRIDALRATPTDPEVEKATEGVVSLDAWAPRAGRKRVRVDRRQGRAGRSRRAAAPVRGRAA